MINFNGMRVISDSNMLADTKERNFPISKHRSKRIHKKLLKRFGSEFKRVPAIFVFNNTIYAHPVRYRELKEQLNFF